MATNLEAALEQVSKDLQGYEIMLWKAAHTHLATPGKASKLIDPDTLQALIAKAETPEHRVILANGLLSARVLYSVRVDQEGERAYDQALTTVGEVLFEDNGDGLSQFKAAIENFNPYHLSALLIDVLPFGDRNDGAEIVIGSLENYVPIVNAVDVSAVTSILANLECREQKHVVLQAMEAGLVASAHQNVDGKLDSYKEAATAATNSYYETEAVSTDREAYLAMIEAFRPGHIPPHVTAKSLSLEKPTALVKEPLRKYIGEVIKREMPLDPLRTALNLYQRLGSEIDREQLGDIRKDLETAAETQDMYQPVVDKLNFLHDVLEIREKIADPDKVPVERVLADPRIFQTYRLEALLLEGGEINVPNVSSFIAGGIHRGSMDEVNLAYLKRAAKQGAQRTEATPLHNNYATLLMNISRLQSELAPQPA